MSFKHSKNTEVWLDALDVSSYFRSVGVGVVTATADTTTFKATWKTAIVGASSSSTSLDGLYDPTLTTSMEALLGIDPTTVLTIAPAGALAIGDRVRLIQATSTSYIESSPVGGVVAFKWTVHAEGAVGLGQVLHILSEDTNTTTGATKTDAASTSTGWHAHLHVTAVEGGSWVIKLEDASVSNFSDGADVTGGAFTAATGATSQRLAGATSATLRRYVRYVATRTGGSVGDGISFALAYSRQ